MSDPNKQNKQNKDKYTVKYQPMSDILQQPLPPKYFVLERYLK